MHLWLCLRDNSLSREIYFFAWFFLIKLQLFDISLLVGFSQILNVLIEGVVHDVLKAASFKLPVCDRRDSALRQLLTTVVFGFRPHEEVTTFLVCKHGMLRADVVHAWVGFHLTVVATFSHIGACAAALVAESTSRIEGIMSALGRRC